MLQLPMLYITNDNRAHSLNLPSNYSRLVIQGTPPFLIVHMNAACCRLTGIDAHFLVGKPLSALLSIPSFTFEDVDVEEQAIDNANTDTKPSTTTMNTSEVVTSAINAKAMTTAIEQGEMHMTIDKLITTCGCDGQLHLVNVRTKLLPPSVDSEEQHQILCRLSMAPIVVSKDTVGNPGGGGTTDNHDPSKRARYQYNQTGTQDTSPIHQELKFPLITHFVIQFEMYDNDQYGDSMESLSSSNSGDEQPVAGSTPSDKNLPQHNATAPEESKTGPTGNTNTNHVEHNVEHDASNVEGTDLDGSLSVQSSDREPIVAIG